MKLGWILKKLIAVVLLQLCLISGAYAGKAEDEAKAFVEKAVEHFKKVGLVQASKDFQTNPGPWISGELYLFVYDFKGTNLAFGINPKVNGKNYWDLQSADGKHIVREMAALAEKKGNGWVDYTWINPESRKFEEKQSYVARIPGENIFIGTGIYKEK